MDNLLEKFTECSWKLLETPGDLVFEKGGHLDPRFKKMFMPYFAKNGWEWYAHEVGQEIWYNSTPHTSVFSK